jgi:predicted nucleic acid-binding protein
LESQARRYIKGLIRSQKSEESMVRPGNHYLDASALVKLVADDPDDAPGRDVLLQYYHQHTNMLTTSHCLSEALSIFKVKFHYRKRITQTDYLRYIDIFIRVYVGGKLRIDEMPILSPKLLTEAVRLIKQYNLDFIDCVQIVTILRGKYSVLGRDSQSILITADRDLAKAARSEGARVWECTSESWPAGVT